MQTAMVVASSGGIGRAVAESLAARGETVVVGGSDIGRAETAAAEIGNGAIGAVLDLADPPSIGQTAARVLEGRTIDHLVMSSVGSTQFANSVRDFDLERARHFVTLKLLGYAATVAALEPLLSERASIVLLGGQGREHPYAGSTMVTAINGGVASIVKSMAMELAPRRVNGVHPGVVGDSPRRVALDTASIEARVLTGELVTLGQVVDAVLFLLDNDGVNATNLAVDGGWLGE